MLCRPSKTILWTSLPWSAVACRRFLACGNTPNIPMTAQLTTSTRREKARGVVIENLPLSLLRKRQRQKFLNVSTHVRHARAGPISAEEHLISDLLQPRKIFQQLLGRNPGNIHMHVLVPADEEEGLFHPQRPAAVRQDHHQIRVVHADVVG